MASVAGGDWLFSIILGSLSVLYLEIPAKDARTRRILKGKIK